MTLLSCWEPLRGFSAMQDRMNRLFRESYSPEVPEATSPNGRRRRRTLGLRQNPLWRQANSSAGGRES
jgi:hypothetical protein